MRNVTIRLEHSNGKVTMYVNNQIVGITDAENKRAISTIILKNYLGIEYASIAIRLNNNFAVANADALNGEDRSFSPENLYLMTRKTAGFNAAIRKHDEKRKLKRNLMRGGAFIF